MKHTLRLAVLAACLPAAACAARGGTHAAGGEAPPHEHAPATPDSPSHAHAPAPAHGAMLPATPGPGYTVADVRFMQGMIGHHAQAIAMAKMAPTHGAGERVSQLAQKIDISQRDEIGFMERWLADRGQAVPDDEQRHAMQMPGMLTPEQMAQLDAARGREFDRLFLTFMIQHHRGALDMVAALFDDPLAAQDPDIFRFITDVDADQRAEIYVMQSMLGMLATTGGSGSR